MTTRKTSRNEGFLLIELMISLVLGTVALAILASWLGLCNSRQRDSFRQLEAITWAHTIIERIATEPLLREKSYHKEGSLEIQWRLYDWQPITLITPKSGSGFKRVIADVSWMTSQNIKKTISITSGIVM